MTKNFKNLFYLFTLALLFLGAFGLVKVASAQQICAVGYVASNGTCVPADSEYIFLAPIETNGGGTGDSFNHTDTSALGKYLNLMIKIVIGLSAVMAVMMFVIGGVEYMTSELMSTKESAKSRMSGAVFGLIIALGAYALLYTINPELLRTDITIPEAVLQIDLEADVPQTYDPVTKKYKNGATFGNPWDDSVAPNAKLPPYVTAKNPPCTYVGQPGCTSIRGLLTGVLRNIQWGCKCSIVVTGGSESWLHGGRSGNTSHAVGSATVDLRRSPELDAYLSGGQQLQMYKRYPTHPDGDYLFEGNHWHIGR